MTTLQSYILFDHCSVDTSSSDNSDPIEDTSNSMEFSVNPTTGLPMAANSGIDVCGTPLGCSDTTQEMFASDCFGIDTCPIGIDDHTSTSAIVDNTSGFMLNDSGGMATFDDSHGATDWFNDDLRICDNTFGDF